MIEQLLLTGVGLVVGVLGVTVGLRSRRGKATYIAPGNPEPPPELGWIIPGVLPGDVSKRNEGDR